MQKTETAGATDGAAAKVWCWASWGCNLRGWGWSPSSPSAGYRPGAACCKMRSPTDDNVIFLLNITSPSSVKCRFFIQKSLALLHALKLILFSVSIHLFVYWFTMTLACDQAVWCVVSFGISCTSCRFESRLLLRSRSTVIISSGIIKKGGWGLKLKIHHKIAYLGT